jgi:hypothetical protein
MADTVYTSHPPDICLLLRVHGEQRWLITRVIPVLRQLEEPGAIEPDEAGTALAYLEVVWLEAGLLAAETDAAAEELSEMTSGTAASLLSEKADRYHAAVRRLRHAVDRRVRVLTAPAPETAGETTGS